MNTLPELLAPAGTLEAVQAVCDAGADAIYVSGKTLNMRQHRASYNFSEDQAEAAIALAHDRDKKLYFTLNSLIFEKDLETLRKTLTWVGRACPDALIVQDLAVASLAREICVHIPLHASTMMNVHNAQTALVLKLMGFTRVITSRDIPLIDMSTIATEANLEVECFIHGDLCVAQGAQCYLSGISLGESANCGRCMKPCRWQWQLVTSAGQVPRGGPSEGYLLARKDMSMLDHIPDMVQHGIASLKIEGRMRTAEFLAPIIGLYRQALDTYRDDPEHYQLPAEAQQDILDRRVREYTTGHMFGRPGLDGIDPSGQREPRFFSQAGPKARFTLDRDLAPPALDSLPDLIVHVRDITAAHRALQAGVDAVYLNGDGLRRSAEPISFDAVETLLETCLAQDKRLVFLLPAITDRLDLDQWTELLEELSDLDGLGIGVSNLGALQVAKSLRFRDILADVGLNVANHVAADELSTLGVTHATAAVEMNLIQLADCLAKARLPLDVLVQGPLPGMLLEHCVLATAENAVDTRDCSQNCTQGDYLLQDSAGLHYPLACDTRCRNHLYTATDVCALPNLARLVSCQMHHLRLECQLDNPDTVALIVASYRTALDALKNGQAPEVSPLVQQIQQATGRPLSDGPWDIRSYRRRKEIQLVRY
jgi:U32 family peptidase